LPIYEYDCADCGEQVELFQRLNDPPPDACETCGGAMRRMVSAPAFQFKGTGWYVTDYGGRRSSDAGEKSDSTAGGNGEPSSGEGDGKKALAASASKPEAVSKAE
jgi:putative FmdB family regulatory protein